MKKFYASAARLRIVILVEAFKDRL